MAKFMNVKTVLLSASSLAMLGIALSASAQTPSDVKPNALFSDHMVLENGVAVPVWGTAAPGERVTVKLGAQTQTAVTDAAGKWTVRLPKLKSGGPFTMTISGAKGTSALTINDVLVGEVWLGSGQSNMVFNVSNTGHRPYGLLDEKAEIAAANYPQVRMFTVADTKSLEPQTEVKGEWKVCTPENVADFSAIGYLFARDLNQALKVPVGVILSAYGASTAEAWVPRETLAADPVMKPVLDGFDAREAAFKSRPPAAEAAVSAQSPPVAATLLNPGAGASITPGGPPPAGTPPPAARTGRRGAGGGDPVQDQHQPTVLYNGMIAPIVPYAIRGAIWYQGESILGNPGIPAYPHVMDLLVSEWRKRWNEGNFPFFAVQLAALKNNSNNPRVREAQAQILSLPNTGLAVTIDIGDPANVHPKNKEPLADRLSRIALADAYGRRIEYSGPVYASMKVEGAAIRVAFTHAQGLTTHYPAGLYDHVSGPSATGVTPSVPLPPQDGPLKWFQIAGADGKYVDAQAAISGSTVVVSSPEVAAPVSVRYAWDNYPLGANLYNAAGLPAIPFRTNKLDDAAAKAP
jgi:sialate O-acetylesterase